ncbi:MAG: MFS transporter [Nitrospirae bacterium]|nr:MFS transporter [Candidatus Manganitrophaceae bacterium]
MKATAPPPVTRREQISWCLYDFANSAFTTVIVTVAYSVYFTEVVAKEGGATLWGRGIAFSMLLVALLSPILGALADYSGKKKRFLFFFTVVCILFTALLYFVREGEWFRGLLFFTIANVGYNAALTFYDAFLKELTSDERMGRLSGYGWAVGYIGGFFSLLIVAPLIRGGFDEASLPAFRFSFVVTALFFLLFSLPLFLWVRERLPPQGPPRTDSYLKIGFKRMANTFVSIRRFRELIKFFIAYLFYNDAINTVIVFSSIFARQVLQFTPSELVTYFIITQVSAAAGAFLFAPLTDRLGPKRTISITLVGWILVVIWAYQVETRLGFYGVGLSAGSILGATQSASRTLLARFAPLQKSAEFFGFFSLTGKISASIGPLFYGEIVRWTGSQRWATLSLTLFFLIGLILLQMVNEQKGIRSAADWQSGPE